VGLPASPGAASLLTPAHIPSRDRTVTSDFNEILRFGFLVHDVSRMRRIVVDRVLKPLGITRSQWWVLAFLSRRDGMTQTALAADLDLTKVAIGGLINRLEESGLIDRRGDASDGRARRVYLTRSGSRMVATIRVNVESVERDILDDISEDDFTRTAATLVTIKKRLLSLIGEYSPAEKAELAGKVGFD
jgi:DNA-binding MarR family transcriptional regulator